MEAIYELLRRNGISATGLQEKNPAQKAKTFAHFMAGLWFFYSIGAWFGSRFIVLEGEASGAPLLFGATLVVWFCAFFSYVAIDLVRKKVKYS